MQKPPLSRIIISVLVRLFSIVSLVQKPLLISSLIICFISLNLIQANFFQARANYAGVLNNETLQTNPKERQVQVTATMPDVIPPSIPILINPENHSLLNHNAITFSWYGSVDNVAVDHYQLWLNGQIYLDNLPLVTTGRQNYALTVDSINNIFYLTLTPPLKDGQYTWNIVAVDTSDNIRSSAIWEFTLDTQAPLFIINKVDTTPTSISAYNADSVPYNPITIVNPDPWIDGVGEAGSQVTLTLTLNGNLLATYQFVIDNQGLWRINLANVLPKDQVVILKFVIVDKVGNISVIDNLPIIYPSKYLEIKVPAVIAPPITYPGEEQPPNIKLPYLSPTELKLRLYAILNSLLPLKARIIFTQSLNQIAIIRQKHDLINYLAWIIMLAPLITSFIYLLVKTQAPFKLKSWQSVIWALGFRWHNLPGGIVVSLPGFWPLKYAPVKLISLTPEDNNQKHQLTVLTNAEGIFPTIKPNQTKKDLVYYLDINHPSIGFPSLANKPNWLEPNEWYQQQPIKLEKGASLPLLIIPVDNHNQDISPNPPITHWYDLAKLRGKWVWPHLTSMGLATLVFSSIPNFLAVAFYLINLVACWWLNQKKKQFSVKLIDSQKRAIANVVGYTSSFDTNNQQNLVWLGQSNQNGSIELHTRDNKLALRLVYPYYKTQNRFIKLEQGISEEIVIPMQQSVSQ